MFWANSAGEQEIADVIVLGVGVCFGAIHCLEFFIFDPHRGVDLENIKCHYNCCPYVYSFDVAFGYFGEQNGLYCY